jgi:hypothetical protein
MPAPIYTNEAALTLCGNLDTALLLSKLRLYQTTPGAPLSPATTQAQLAAALATFTGYADITVAALLPPYLDPTGGASTQVPTQQFASSGPALSNMIQGFWLEDATGHVYLAGDFDQPIPMKDVGDAIPIDIKFQFGN